MQTFAQEILVLDNSTPPHSLLGGDGRIIQKRPPPSLPQGVGDGRKVKQ